MSSITVTARNVVISIQTAVHFASMSPVNDPNLHPPAPKPLDPPLRSATTDTALLNDLGFLIDSPVQGGDE